MAYIGAIRSIEPFIFGRFEWQQRQHVIDVAAHAPRPPWPPRPNAWADVIDDRQMGSGAAHAPGYSMGEVRTIDDDEHVGLRGDHGIHDLADENDQLRQTFQHRENTHDRDIA